MLDACTFTESLFKAVRKLFGTPIREHLKFRGSKREPNTLNRSFYSRNFLTYNLDLAHQKLENEKIEVNGNRQRLFVRNSDSES